MRPRLSSLTSFSLSRFLRPCMVCVIAVFIIEIIVFNCVALYIFWYLWGLKEMVTAVLNTPGRTWPDKLAANPLFQEFVSAGKDGQFVHALQETFERLYIESCDAHGPVTEKTTANQCEPRLHFIGLDVSSAGEALYVYRRIQQGPKMRPWSNLVVDIGSNDGLLSSNSFNFIKWGWSAVLVEPQSYQNQLAQRNLLRYIDPYDTGSHSVSFVEGVVAEKDGYQNLVLSGDIVQMESRMLAEGEEPMDNEVVIRVQSYTVKTLAEEQEIPKHFGLLSIDAEGASNMILRQWMECGYRPAYVIYEHFHQGEPHSVTVRFMKKYGYRFLVKRQWNLIFEYAKFNHTAN